MGPWLHTRPHAALLPAHRSPPHTETQPAPRSLTSSPLGPDALPAPKAPPALHAGLLPTCRPGWRDRVWGAPAALGGLRVGVGDREEGREDRSQLLSLGMLGPEAFHPHLQSSPSLGHFPINFNIFQPGDYPKMISNIQYSSSDQLEQQQACPVWVHSAQAHLCPTLCDPMDGSLPGPSLHGIFQARVLERVAVSFSRGPFQPWDRTCVSCVSCVGR